MTIYIALQATWNKKKFEIKVKDFDINQIKKKIIIIVASLDLYLKLSKYDFTNSKSYRQLKF